MTTPSSSATSPSPPIAYLTHTAAPMQQSLSASSTSSEKDQRKKAVQKFLARAEISMVTRALRARLSYASYKATHNVPHLSLYDLEARVPSQPQSTQPGTQHRSITAKRKVATLPRGVQNATTIIPAGQPISGSTHRRGGSDSMAPPATVSSSRNSHHPTTNRNAAVTHPESDPNFRARNSLYTSILAPPPNKQARTVHNAHEPPIPPHSRTAPVSSPRARPAKPSSGRGRGRAKLVDQPAKPANSPSQRRKTSSIDKGKQKQAQIEPELNVDADGDVAMKAAQTLTSWLLHNRQPSVTNPAGSPRSSFDGSDTNSTYSHFAQSSARTTTTAVGSTASAASPAAASITSTAEPPARSRTPSPASKVQEHSTPRTAPTDDEAVDLMLLFATSPSPARPTTVSKDARDMAAFRALSGGNDALLTKGRVLFPTSGEMPGAEESSSPSGARHQHQYRHQHTRSGPPLARGSDGGSFSSSISSISSHLGRRGSADATAGSGGLSRLGSSSSSHLGPSQLLPPPPLPIHDPTSAAAGTTTPEHATGRGLPSIQSPKSSGGQTAEFNLSDFINASPSPLRVGTGQGQSLSLSQVAHKPGLGLRADVGRKLFEEEQMKNTMQDLGTGPIQAIANGPNARGLGAGIDLDAMRSAP